ncbi:MAG: hypothetical protein JNJ55_12940 [Betaproteobacteria bacterium]|nr:hypothetical protein [Betaproteobacteria bacterium]
MSLFLLALLQLAFTLCWTVYVLFLPDLAARAGISKSWIVVILMADQVIFAVMDWALGANADRVAENMKRFGLWIAAVCAISTLAFVMLPYIAPATSAGVFIAVIVVWSLSASILRAPPLVLLARHADMSARPAIAGAFAFGLGIAGALAPYVTLNLKGVDPRAPFLLVGLVTLVATLVLVWLPRSAVSPAPQAEIKIDPPQVPPLLIAGLLLAIGFQIHFAMNAAPRYLAFMKSPELPYWMPVFWIGFSLAVFPVSMWLKRVDAQRAIVAGAVVGALALLLAPRMPAIEFLAACEFAAGCGWALCFLGLVQAALTLGASGREGSIAGRLFALFAVAIFIRLGVTLSGIAIDAPTREVLQFTAATLWIGAALILWRAFDRRRD